MRITALYLTAAIGLSPAIAHSEEVSYRDGSEDVDFVIAEPPLFIPLSFIPREQHFAVVSQDPRRETRQKFNAARLEMAGEKLEALVLKRSVIVTSQPWQPMSDGLSDGMVFVPKLVECSWTMIDYLSCTAYPGRDSTARWKIGLSAGEEVMEFTLDPSQHASENDFDIAFNSPVKVFNSTFSFEGRFDSEMAGLSRGMNTGLVWKGLQAKQLVEATSDDQNLTVSYTLADGSQRSYDIPALDLKKAYAIIRPTIRELMVFNQMEKAEKASD